MKVVIAYSGGLDTSVIIKWVKETYQAEAIAFCADLGQEEELDGLEGKAVKTGASKCFIRDIQEEFARDFIFPMIQANAIYEGTYLLGTSIARPLIAKHLIDIARQENADAICHGATGKGNDQVRFELTAYAMEPGIKVIAPWREWDFKSRTDLINYAKEHDIPITATAEKPFSIDRNLLHISFEGGVLEDPWAAPPEDLYVMTRPLEQTPDEAEMLEISFEQGIPVKVNGENLNPAALMRKLNDLGCRHGVGRVDIVENRYVGMKSRGVYETPGGTILHLAHRALESITMDREVMHLRDSWIPQAAITKSQEFVTGAVRMQLYKGNCRVMGRKSEYSLFDEDIVTFEEDDVYNQADAEGFIRLNALRLRVRANSKQRQY